MSYVRYKFQKAISELSRTGSLRDRLVNAYIVNLMYLDVNELPDGIRDDFKRFKCDITRISPGEGALDVETTVQAMDESSIKNMVEMLFRMYDYVTEQDIKLHQVA